MTIQAAKSIVDANSSEELLSMFANGSDEKHRSAIREVDRLFNQYGVLNQAEYDEFKQKNPRLAQTIDNIWNSYQ